MGLPPDVWGPNLWGALHTLCLTGSITPEFVDEYAKVIPCPSCAMHFRQLVDSNPLPTMNQFEWSVDLHNQVNERIGKPVVSVEAARAKWSAIPCAQFDFKILLIIILLVLLLLMYLRK